MFVAFFAVYLIAVALNVMALRKVNLARLTFYDGILLGMTYYITIPMFAVLLAGRIGPGFIPIEDYKPFEQTETTLILIGSIAAFSIVRLLMPRRASTTPVNVYPVGLLTGVLFALYLATTITTFVAAGIGSGGHWFRASHELMEQNAGFVIIKHISNFTRTALFGCLAVLATRSRGMGRIALVAGLLLCLFDLLTTFNRVTLVYYLILVLVCFRRHALVACAGLMLFLYTGAYTSTAFTMFRSQVSVYGYSLSGFASAADAAIRYSAEGEPFVDAMNGVFESINITVFNYVVQHQQELDVSPSAYFVRPLTVLLPRAILPDRPPPFALVLGEHITKSDSLALNSTLFGEPYGSSPLASPLMLGIVLLLYHLAYRGLGRSSQAIEPMAAFIGFAFWRFDSSFAVIALTFTALIHFGLLIAAMGTRDLTRSRRRAPMPGSVSQGAPR
ncbi:hypothetical protein [Sphingomonas jatrophae]|uniref:Oligosaccharide repeat unit polymerase n=1 Tax=Sphingomonas jatrophae TaxID=1166337 RepID=A0A1I6M5B7_9SPHN|nr:hypothetical protein [Sphingomonas jatrophae]SFS10917.1 hypothetical protein SAMN05192580_3489 [Sphingomonas jatrophae]